MRTRRCWGTAAALPVLPPRAVGRAGAVGRRAAQRPPRCSVLVPCSPVPSAGSDDGTVRFWEVCTARCMKTLPVGGVVKSVAWNPNPTVCLVAVGV